MTTDTRLHAAIKRGARPGEVISLISVYPYSCRTRDLLGDLPLHTAIKQRAHPALIAHLVNAYPQSLAVKDRRGKLPISQLIHASAEEEIIMYLVENIAGIGKIVDQKGEIALHHASRRALSIELFECILQSNIPGCMTRNIDGQVPLHILCQNIPDPEIFETLLNVCPHACAVRDLRGYLPIHYLLIQQPWCGWTRKYYRAIKCMIDKSPGMLHVFWNRKLPDETCVDLAIREGCHISIIELLVNKFCESYANNLTALKVLNEEEFKSPSPDSISIEAESGRAASPSPSFRSVTPTTQIIDSDVDKAEHYRSTLRDMIFAGRKKALRVFLSAPRERLRVGSVEDWKSVQVDWNMHVLSRARRMTDAIEKIKAGVTCRNKASIDVFKNIILFL